MKKASRIQIPAVHSMDSVTESTRHPESATSVNIIQEIMSLCGKALIRAVQHPYNDLVADVVLETLVEDIDALTGKKPFDGCSLVRGTAKGCTFATKVTLAMANISSETGKCLDLLDDMIDNQSFDLGLRATLQCLKSINGSAKSLMRRNKGNLEAASDVEDSSIDQW